MPTEIEATYRVVTPMFCAGADPGNAELRMPSFKGVLRFWWRALAWSRLDGALEKIQQEEDTLFGSTASGQSLLSMRLAQSDRRKNILGKNLSVGQGARYLGYGVMESGSDDERECLLPPLHFTVRLRGCDLDNEQLTSLQSALIALGTIGGMGARSRKGFGSLVIKSLRVDSKERWRMPKTVNDLGNRIKTIRPGRGPEDLPEYTALSYRTRHVLVSSHQTEHLRLLDLIGLELKAAIRACDRRKRVAFGLPRGHRNDRRASPLFIHIHECGDRPIAVLSFLPARFLPEGKSDISAGGSRVCQTPEDELYRPIHDFLNRLLDPNERKEPFTEVIEVGS